MDQVLQSEKKTLGIRIQSSYPGVSVSSLRYAEREGSVHTIISRFLGAVQLAGDEGEIATITNKSLSLLRI